MKEISKFTVVKCVIDYVKNLKKEKLEKKQSTKFIDELAQLGSKWWENKVIEVTTILLRGTEERPIYIGELAYAIKGKEFRRYQHLENCRVNQVLDLMMKALWELDLVCIKANAILLGDDNEFGESGAKNTTYGLWWNPKYPVYDVDIPEWEKGLRSGTEFTQTTERMFGNKYVKQYGRGKDRCAETRELLNQVELVHNVHLFEYCNIEHMPDDEDKKKAYELYELRILRKIRDEEPVAFHNEYCPDSRGRLYIMNDMGNYIGLKSLRGLVKFNQVEIANPNAVED